MENQTSSEIELLILMGSFGMVVLVVAIVLFVVIYQKKVLAQQNEIQIAENRHQRELLNASLEVAEVEREKIAKNIHDDVGTSLNVIRLHLTKLARHPGEKELSAELTGQSMELLDDSIAMIRGIAQDLMPPTLVKLGLEKGLIEMGRQINASGELKVILNLQPMSNRLPGKVELQLYRVIREVINNMIKHSAANSINISLQSDASEVCIAIQHDGVGITDETVKQFSNSKKGIGLKSIQSRIQLINASIKYSFSGPGSAEVKIVVPYL